MSKQELGKTFTICLGILQKVARNINQENRNYVEGFSLTEEEYQAIQGIDQEAGE